MKKQIVFAVLFVGVVVAAVFAYMQYDIAAKRAPMLASLKDAGSAQFRNEHTVNHAPHIFEGTTYLCGEVNSKNSMGGYVGFTRYISYPDGYALDGYYIGSFYKDKYLAVKATLESEIALMKELKRKVTENEVNKQAFSDLWDKYCL